MRAAEVLAALDLPDAARVDRRVPKTLLTEHGAPMAADKRGIHEGIERDSQSSSGSGRSAVTQKLADGFTRTG
jgi:hypothetical protein